MRTHSRYVAKNRAPRSFGGGELKGSNQPDQPFAFTKVKVHQCFQADGEHYYEKLPSFVKPSEVGP